MVYQWDLHKDVCYDLYIVQRKPLDDIMAHLKDTVSFTPSKRAFQVQFKKWDFPSKQNPAHRNAELVARIKELWEQNATQREMLATLTREGYDLKERELMRVRAKNRWLLRVPNGMKEKIEAMNLQPEDMTSEQFDSLQAQLESAAGLVTPVHRKIGANPPPLPQEEIKKRKERREELLEESEKRMAAKKRRRRTREWAGLPADPDGLPPRFPSETTLEESKVFLELTHDQYREMRDQFQRICESAGVIKKTICGPEKWAAVKDQLVRENTELQKVFWSETGRTKESKNLALDVICTDVTKRMRVMESRVSMADAKNALGLNPEQSRQIRNAFYNILQADHFESKLVSGDEHWKELKDIWIAGQPILQQVLAPGDSDPEHQKKTKAIELLCRDVMKRLRDDHSRNSTGQHTTRHIANNTELQPSPEPDSTASHQAQSTTGSVVPPAAAVAAAASRLADSSLQLSNLDPNLLTGSEPGSSYENAPLGALPTFLRRNPAPVSIATPAPPTTESNAVDRNPKPIYIRPHASSTLPAGAPSKMFCALLSEPTLSSLTMLVEDHWPGITIEKIDGIEKPAQLGGQEMKYLIEDDEELEAYLAHTEGRKSAFSIVLRSKP